MRHRNTRWLLGLAALIGTFVLVATGLRAPIAEAAVPSITSISVNSNCDAQGGFTGTVTLSGSFTGTVTLELYYHVPSGQFTDSGVSTTATFTGGSSATYSFPAFSFAGANSYRIQVSSTSPVTLGGLTVKSNSVPPCTPVTPTPTVATTLSNTTVSLGQSVTDKATVSGGNNPTGSITFTVFPNSSCTQGTSVFSSGPIGLAGGSATSGAFTPSATGTYYWQASYSGDSNNTGASSACTSEVLTVTQQTNSAPCGDSTTFNPSTGLPSPGTFVGPQGQGSTPPTTVGTRQDYFNSCSPNGSRFTPQSSETLSKICAYVGPVAAAPENQFSVALYSDAAGAPGSLITNSGVGTLTADSWNCLPIPTQQLTGGTAYWLMFWSNSSAGSSCGPSQPAGFCTGALSGAANRLPCPDNSSSGADDNLCIANVAGAVSAFWFPAALTTFGTSPWPTPLSSPGSWQVQSGIAFSIVGVVTATP